MYAWSWSQGLCRFTFQDLDICFTFKANGTVDLVELFLLDVHTSQLFKIADNSDN